MAFTDIVKGIPNVIEKGTDTIDSVASGNFGAVAQSVGFIRFLWWVKMLIWLVVIVSAIIGFYHFYLRYNKRVLVKKLKGNAIIDSYFDRGIVKTDEKKRIKLLLLRTKKSCPVPSYRYTSKMGKQDFYEVYLDERGNLYPINDEPLIDKIKSGVTSDKDIDFHILASWRLEDIKLDEDRYSKKGFLQKHMPEIMVFMAMILITVMVWVTMKGIERVGVEHAMAIKELAQALAGLR